MVIFFTLPKTQLLSKEIGELTPEKIVQHGDFQFLPEKLYDRFSQEQGLSNFIEHYKIQTNTTSTL